MLVNRNIVIIIDKQQQHRKHTVKKKNNFQSVDSLIQLEQYFCWKPYLCCALPLFMSHPLFPSQNKKINKKKRS